MTTSTGELSAELCTATTRAGNPCRNHALVGETLCIFHSPTPEAEAWRDLQLPLYAWWARTTLCNDTWPEVGYFLVGRSMAKIGVDAAKWPDPVFESAFDAARLVISAIRRGGPFSRTDTPGECRNCGYKGICQR